MKMMLLLVCESPDSRAAATQSIGGTKGDKTGGRLSPNLGRRQNGESPYLGQIGGRVVYTPDTDKRGDLTHFWVTVIILNLLNHAVW